jgi:flagellar export protein FliJ
MAFVFRAAAALDIRRREEESARQRLAGAERAVNDAAARLQEAERAVAEEAERLVGIQRHGTEAWRIACHQAWIEQQRRVVVERGTELSARRAEAKKAAAAAIEAATRRKVLERLRERAWRRHRRAEDEQHIRDMNELATLRFVAQGAGGKGTHAD